MELVYVKKDNLHSYILRKRPTYYVLKGIGLYNYAYNINDIQIPDSDEINSVKIQKLPFFCATNTLVECLNTFVNKYNQLITSRRHILDTLSKKEFGKLMFYYCSNFIDYEKGITLIKNCDIKLDNNLINNLLVKVEDTIKFHPSKLFLTLTSKILNIPIKPIMRDPDTHIYDTAYFCYNKLVAE